MAWLAGRRAVGGTPDSQGSRPTGFHPCSCGNSYSGTASLASTRTRLKKAKRLTVYGFSYVGGVSSGVAPGGQQTSAMAEAMARLEQFRYQR